MKRQGKDRKMKILGIDPGSINCGYGIIQTQNAELKTLNTHPKMILQPTVQNSQYVYIVSGRIVLPARKPLHVRLKKLYESLSDMISEYKPDEIIIEEIFFAKGIKTALSLGHTRGVILLAAALTGLPIYEYSALEVKKAVVGYGRADKLQIQKMIQNIFKIDHMLSEDGADAIALALCHVNTRTVYVL